MYDILSTEIYEFEYVYTQFLPCCFKKFIISYNTHISHTFVSASESSDTLNGIGVHSMLEITLG